MSVLLLEMDKYKEGCVRVAFIANFCGYVLCECLRSFGTVPEDGERKRETISSKGMMCREQFQYCFWVSAQRNIVVSLQKGPQKQTDENIV